MKIPRKIKIAGLEYTVSIVTEPDELEHLAGRTNHNNQTIKLKKMARGRMEQTFIHEVVHCLNNEMGELDVEFFAIGLYQFLKDNKI